MLSLKDRRRSAVSKQCRDWRGGGQPVSAKTIRRTLHQIAVHGCHPWRKPPLKTIHKKARKQFAEDMSTKHMDYRNHVLSSDEMKIYLFAYSQAWRWECHGMGLHGCCRCWRVTFQWGKHELQHVLWNNAVDPPFQKLGCGAVFQHDNDPKHTSKTTTALLKRLKVKVMDWPIMSPDLNPIEHLWGILKWKVEVRKVSYIRQLRAVVMGEWKSIPVATCEALVNSMPRRVKAVLDNDVGQTKYCQLTWCMSILKKFPKG